MISTSTTLLKLEMEDTVTKAAKKNQKRRTGKKTKTNSETSETTLESVTHDHEPTPSIVPFDPVADLKLKIEQAKAEKDHDLAQKLRQELWVLQDTVQLGRPGPSAPQLDMVSVLSPQKSLPRPYVGVSSVSESTDPTEKTLGKLKKKLQQIESLKQRQASGEKLEANQLAKIQTEPDIQEEIDILEGLLQSNQLR